jgi:hypothetical protein
LKAQDANNATDASVEQESARKRQPSKPPEPMLDFKQEARKIKRHNASYRIFAVE